MRKVQVTRPPNKEAFVKAGDAERMVLLTNAWIRQTGRLTECNANFGTLQGWKDDILKAYPDTQFVESREEFDRYVNSNR